MHQLQNIAAARLLAKCMGELADDDMHGVEFDLRVQLGLAV